LSDDTDVLLLGRHEELERITERFDARSSALVLLVGEVGSGKSSLLRAAAGEAEKRGWRVVGPDAGGSALTVDAGTSEHTFADRVTELLGSAAAPQAWRSVPGADAHAIAAREPWRTTAHTLARELSAHAPLVVMIDGFDARGEFAGVFDRLVARVRQNAEAVVFIVAARSVDVRQLVRAADEVIELGPLAEEPVRQYFEGLVLDPPLSPEEVDAYVAESVKRPAAASALGRVLLLARRRTETS
jgi:energy-coupling factor transporter ATP-binding protein EcfA2